jgi:hypothetical protein
MELLWTASGVGALNERGRHGMAAGGAAGDGVAAGGMAAEVRLLLQGSVGMYAVYVPLDSSIPARPTLAYPRSLSYRETWGCRIR